MFISSRGQTGWCHQICPSGRKRLHKRPSGVFHVPTSWLCLEQRWMTEVCSWLNCSQISYCSCSSFLLPKVFVGIDIEVVFITDGKLWFCLLCFSLFLPCLPFSFRQSGQINWHLVNNVKNKVSGQRCEVYQCNNISAITCLDFLSEAWQLCISPVTHIYFLCFLLPFFCNTESFPLQDR